MTTNPALDELRFLVGAWDMELSEASFLPDPETKLRGSVIFQWVEGGAALAMRMGDAGTPTATWIIGRDDAEPGYHVLYADGRGVSRVYRMSFGDGTWRMWRDTPEFSQRFEAEVGARPGGDQRLLAEVGGWRHDLGARLRRPLHPPTRRAWVVRGSPGSPRGSTAARSANPSQACKQDTAAEN